LLFEQGKEGFIVLVPSVLLTHSKFGRFGFAFALTALIVLALCDSTLHSAELTLTWIGVDNTESPLDGYRVYSRAEGEEYNYSWPEWAGYESETACTIYGLAEDTMYCFVVRAVDVGGNESSDSNEVCYLPTVNACPVADAGPDQIIEEGNTVTLDGTKSWDPDGTVLSYSWTQIEGNPLTLFDETMAQPTFTAPAVGQSGESFIFQLTVLDENGLQSSDTCTVEVVPLNMESADLALNVSSISVALAQKGSHYQARAYIIILDETGIVVKEAVVKGDWSLNGIPLNTSLGSTNGRGEAKLDSAKVSAKPGDMITLMITGVTMNGYYYDPSLNTENSKSTVVP
jgi:hypothetical protein